MMEAIVVRPAYGRSYETEAAMMRDWEGGKDFRIILGPYCSIRDLGKMREAGVKKVTVIGGGDADSPHVEVRL